MWHAEDSGASPDPEVPSKELPGGVRAARQLCQYLLVYLN